MRAARMGMRRRHTLDVHSAQVSAAIRDTCEWALRHGYPQLLPWYRFAYQLAERDGHYSTSD
jgi:hypothetical protein